MNEYLHRYKLSKGGVYLMKILIGISILISILKYLVTLYVLDIKCEKNRTILDLTIISMFFQILIFLGIR